MDLATAINHRRRLHSELDSISDQGLTLSSSRKLLAMEISRLDLKITSESWRSVSDVKIPVENAFLIFQVSNDFKLRGLSALVDFKRQLMAELQEIYKLRPLPLSLTFQFVRNVTERLADEISRQQENQRSSFRAPPRRIGGWHKFVDICVNDAIDLVIKNNPEGGDLCRVINCLKENPSIEVDDNVIRLVRQRYFEATFPLHSKQAPAELPIRPTQL